MTKEAGVLDTTWKTMMTKLLAGPKISIAGSRVAVKYL
jgi:hypothetical protein